jgi:POT family proton-dependent oligopeptide transporter
MQPSSSEPKTILEHLEQLQVYTEGYKQLAIYALIAGVLLVLISPWVKKLMQEVK